MSDKHKTKAQLIAELEALRQQVAELEAAEAERKRAKAALQESEMRYRTLIENIPIGVYRNTPDLKGGFLMANPAFLGMFGFGSWEELEQVAMVDLYVDPHDRELFSDYLLARGSATGVELRLKKKDDTPIWGSVTARVVHDETTGKVSYFDCTIEDITKRKRTEEDIKRLNEDLERRVAERTAQLDQVIAELYKEIAEHKRAEAHLAGVLDIAGDAIIILDEHMRIQTFNDAAEHVFGYLEGEAIGQPVDLLISPRSTQAHHQRMDNFMAASEASRYIGGQEAFGWRKDGSEFPAEASVSKLAQGGQATFIAIVRDVTERGRMEEALRESEMRYRIISELVSDYAYALRIKPDGAFACEWMTEAAARAVGHTFEEIDAHDIMSFIHPDDAPIASCHVQTILSGQPDVSEFRAVTKSGEVHWLRNFSRPIWDEAHERIIGVIGTAQDITEHKRADAALHESEERYRRRSAELQALYDVSLRLNAQLDTPELLRLIVEQAAALLGVEAGGLYIYNSQRNEVVCTVGVGYAAEFVGRVLKPGEGVAGCVFESRRSMFVEDYHTWPGRAAVYADDPRLGMVLAVPLTGQYQQGVLVIMGSEKRALDEHDIWLAELFAAQASAALENVHLYGEAQRRTKELAALNKASQTMASVLDRDEVLKALMAETRDLLDAEGTSVLLYDFSGSELVFAAVDGPRADELLGTRLPLTAGIAGWVMREKQSVLVNDVRNDPRFYDQVDAQTGLTTRSLAAVPLTMGELVIGVVEAINPRVSGGEFTVKDLETLEMMAGSAAIAIENARLFQAERDLRRRVEQSRAQLVRSERLSAIGRLAASVAHEINNPLQSVLGCLGLAQEALVEGEDVGEYLRVAREEVHRIARIVARMRDLYRQESGEKALTKVDTLMAQVLDLTRKRCQESQVEIDWQPTADLPPMQLVPDQIKQVFLNLLLNAIDAMPRGGRLRVTMDLTRDPLGVRIGFHDSGVGIPPDELPHIFKDFYSTKPDGTGLGLPISADIVERHGGRIEVESRVGAGSTFMVWLPA